MNIFKTELFPYIEGESLIGKIVTLTMAHVWEEELTGQHGRERKYVLYFKESPKGLVLNKTNAKRIAKLYGAETDDWSGQSISIYAEEVTAFGEVHNAVRVVPSIPTNGNGKPQAEQAALVPEDEEWQEKEDAMVNG